MRHKLGLLFGAIGVACSGAASDDAAVSDPEPPSSSAIATAEPASTTTTTPPTTSTTTSTTTTEPKQAKTPEFAGIEMQDNNSGDFEIFVKVWDEDMEPIDEVADATIEVWIRDEVKEELFRETYSLSGTDLGRWTRTISGEEFSAYKIIVPARRVERSLSGSSGTIEARLAYPYGIFEISDDVRNLPEASEAEKTAASSASFSDSAIPLEVAEVSTRRWRVQPLRAGCYRHFGKYDVKNGVRVDVQVASRENSINTFFDDALLQTPEGLTIEPDYESPARGLDVIPGDVVEGFFMFIDIPCQPGTYRFVMSDYRSLYLDINFELD